jgi:hypothetical protein
LTTLRPRKARPRPTKTITREVVKEKVSIGVSSGVEVAQIY